MGFKQFTRLFFFLILCHSDRNYQESLLVEVFDNTCFSSMFTNHFDFNLFSSHDWKKQGFNSFNLD